MAHYLVTGHPGSDRRGRRSEHARARVLPETNCIITAKCSNFRRKAHRKTVGCFE